MKRRIEIKARGQATIPFVKAHACGNDFLIVEEPDAGGAHAALARRLCSRNTGIGADGIEFLERRGAGDFFLRLFNADGSEAELSGNGTRCVAAWLAHSEGLREVAIGTLGGARSCRVIDANDPVYLIETGMGVPRVEAQTIDIPGVGAVAGAVVNVGNPHFVLFVEREDFGAHGLAWQELGAKISASPLFTFRERMWSLYGCARRARLRFASLSAGAGRRCLRERGLALRRRLRCFFAALRAN